MIMNPRIGPSALAAVKTAAATACRSSRLTTASSLALGSTKPINKSNNIFLHPVALNHQSLYSQQITCRHNHTSSSSTSSSSESPSFSSSSSSIFSSNDAIYHPKAVKQAFEQQAKKTGAEASTTTGNGTNSKDDAASATSSSTGEVDYMLFHPIYTSEELKNVSITHKPLDGFRDYVAYGLVRTMRYGMFISLLCMKSAFL
jgi:CCR4-NOT transcriptional regulation complex NOT5 subunit